MKTKSVLFIIAVVLLIVGAILTINTVFRRESSSLFSSNVEALATPEAYEPGTGECYKDYTFSMNAIFLSCGSCRYFYGVPLYYWDTGSCN